MENKKKIYHFIKWEYNFEILLIKNLIYIIHFKNVTQKFLILHFLNRNETRIKSNSIRKKIILIMWKSYHNMRFFSFNSFVYPHFLFVKESLFMVKIIFYEYFM